MKITREQIIELINQYVYANGRQLITGEQLNEILNIIADSFALEGEASSGLNAVLERDSRVSERKEIINEHGGRIKLASEELLINVLRQVIGIEVSDKTNRGIIHLGKDISTVGTVRTTEEENAAEKGLFENMTKEMFPPASEKNGGVITEEPLSFSTGSLYISSKGGQTPYSIGSHTFHVDDNTQSLVSVSNQGIKGSVHHNQKEISYSTYQNVGINIYSLTIQAGEEKSNANQNANSFTISFSQSNSESNFKIISELKGQRWQNEFGDIASISSSGIHLAAEKKIELKQGGESQTAGLATLSEGGVIISTPAITSKSVISLTVQAQGKYAGNIRVENIEPSKSFTISSTNREDNCVVFWQIIELQ